MKIKWAAVVGVVVLWLACAGAMADDHPDAAALVRQARAYEAWVDSVSSLRIRADEHCVRPPQGVAKRKNELQAQFPGEDVSGYRDLKPEKDGHVDLAFDRSRVRFRATTVQEDDDLRSLGRRTVYPFQPLRLCPGP